MFEYITRADAIQAGLSRYFTGGQCRHGHIAQRGVHSGTCCECQRIRQREHNSAYRARVKDTGSSGRATTRGVCGKTTTTLATVRDRAKAASRGNEESVRLAAKRHYKNNVALVNKRSKSNRLLRHLGITLEDYELLMSAHDGKCDICGTTEPGGAHGTFNLDHCHATGVLRGVLCRRCNTSIGQFEDRVDLLQAAIEYIQNPPKSAFFNVLLHEEMLR